jgi:hypothetical protein
MKVMYIFIDQIAITEADARTELLKVVVIKSSIFQGIAPCSPLKVNHVSKEQEAGRQVAFHPLHAGFLVGLPLRWSNMFL